MLSLIAALLIGPQLETGEEGRYWTYRSVIYANVLAVKRTGPLGRTQAEKDFYKQTGQGDYAITLRPIATLSGWFDCGEVPGQFDTKAVVSLTTSTLLEPPKVGDNVLVVIGRQPPHLAAELPSEDVDYYEWWIPTDEITYMPADARMQHPAIAKVKDLTDPIITQVLTEIQKRRAKANSP